MMESRKEMEAVDPSMYCQIAIEEALGLCKDPDSAFAEIAAILGLEEKDVAELKPIENSYSIVISSSPVNEYKELQKWVLCKAFELHKDMEMNIRDAVVTAWDEARKLIR